MTMAEVKVKKWGNSMGVIIPRDVVRHEGIRVGDEIKADFLKKKGIDGFGIWKDAPAFKRDHDDHEDLW